MPDGLTGEITLLLRAAKAGHPGAVDRLFSCVYDELRKIASNRINAIGNRAAAPTTVVNEVYLRLFKKVNPTWEDRRLFFWAATRAMRDILSVPEGIKPSGTAVEKRGWNFMKTWSRLQARPI